MNIILITLDTLRKDCVGVYGSPAWGKVHTPHFDDFAEQSLILNRAYPNALPTLPTRIVLYTGQQVYPFEKGNIHLKGDFVGAPGWGPIPEEWPTLAETLGAAGYRTGLISDLHHMFKPSKNFWRGYDQWEFLRGQENDQARSGPKISQEELDYWLPREVREGVEFMGPVEDFVQQCIMNMHHRKGEEDYHVAQVFLAASKWLQQNQDADPFFLSIESFSPHEPWLIPTHYRKMYHDEEIGREQVISPYSDISTLPQDLIQRTQANYSGMVTMCDRWFGHFMETLRVMDLLDRTMVILHSDHGHSLGEMNYLGKRGYPSTPEVYEVPLMVRFPGTEHAGRTSNMFLQHVDLTATIYEVAGIKPEIDLDGSSFLEDALSGGMGSRKHVTVGWGSTPTVITDRWWFNAKADGSGVFLYDLHKDKPFNQNIADDLPDVVNELFALALKDAGGEFPGWLVELASQEADAPGCSVLAARG
jgi:arylsulfatase A-like enzyme